MGNAGESLAAGHLKGLGFKIVARNVRYRSGEIDIIAKRKRELHFIEVKTRKEGSVSEPFESITERKKDRMRRTAELYLNDSRNNIKPNKLPACYFSVIGIDFIDGNPRIECILDAFI